MCMSILGKQDDESSILEDRILARFSTSVLNQVFLIFLLHSLFGKDPPAQKEKANMIAVVIIHSEGMLCEQEYHKQFNKELLVGSISSNEQSLISFHYSSKASPGYNSDFLPWEPIVLLE